ncbi:MAG: hypothetical protein K8S23_10215 [Candidatus Cloacimonetes bacterium]|nr:hypothetical protein [Candidatus Cloacimonadota bacterium]
MKKLVTSFLIIFLTFYAVSCNKAINNPEIVDAHDAYNQLNLELSRNILLTLIEKDNLNNEDKCKVLREIALQDWKFYKEYNLAKKRLTLADSIGSSKTDTWILLNRIEKENEKYKYALSAAKNAVAFAESKAEKEYAQYKYCRTIHDLCIHNINNEISVDIELLTEASSILDQILTSNPFNVDAAEILLGISLMQKNGHMALKGWMLYFRILELNNVNEYLKSAANDINKSLLNWNQNQLNDQNRKILVKALAKSRFYQYAELIAKDLNDVSESTFVQDKEIQDILTYAKYVEKIKKETNKYYRQMAIGKGSERKYKKFLKNENKELFQNLSFFIDKNDKYNETNLYQEIKRHFGTVVSTGKTGSDNFYTLRMGHIVNQSKQIVEQYDYKTDFIFTEIDMMVSNGYSSWFWEYKGTGGWARADGFIRVKEFFKDLPINAWNSITDSLKRMETEEKIDKNLFKVDKENRTAILSGLSAKLKYDALNDLHNKIYNQGYRGTELKFNFMDKYEEYRDNALMFAHEGRHSLEIKFMPKKFKKWTSAEKEFHAKLSQIVFTKEPRFELAIMINGIGYFGHGLANKWIADTAEEWIKNNTDKINGFDQNRSLISQLYLLTNEQIKECYREVDPFYIEQLKK